MSKEQRVFAHWKSLKRVLPMEPVGVVQHGYGFDEYHFKYNFRMPNEFWLYLARTHKMKVREVKDIVNAERARRRAERGLTDG